MINLIDSSTFRRLIPNGTESEFNFFVNALTEIINLTDIQEGIVVPTFKANKHQWYLDIAANKYYRNVDGGTTWVALN